MCKSVNFSTIQGMTDSKKLQNDGGPTNVYIILEWAAVLLTLRTTALDQRWATLFGSQATL